MVVEVMLLVISIGRGIHGVKVSLSALTVVVPEGDIGEDLTEVAHVDTFHPTNFPAIALPRLLMALIVAPLLPAAPKPLPLRHEVDGDAGSSCRQGRVVLLVAVVCQLQA